MAAQETCRALSTSAVWEIKSRQSLWWSRRRGSGTVLRLVFTALLSGATPEQSLLTLKQTAGCINSSNYWLVVIQIRYFILICVPMHHWSNTGILAHSQALLSVRTVIFKTFYWPKLKVHLHFITFYMMVLLCYTIIATNIMTLIVLWFWIMKCDFKS